MKKRIFTILLLSILLLFPGLPSAAQTTENPITGVCHFLEEIQPPEMTAWRTGVNELHIRDKLLTMMCDFSDDRLDGFYQTGVNWDVREFYDPFYYVIGQDYGLMLQMDDDGNAIWHGSRDISYTPPRAFSGKVILSGCGAYAGLTARFDVWGDLEIASLMQLAGRMYEGPSEGS